MLPWVLSDLPGATKPILNFSFGYGLLIAMAIAAVIMAVVFVVLDRLIYRPLRQRGSGIVIFTIASLGVAIAMRSLILIFWASSPRFYVPGIRPTTDLPFGIRIVTDQVFIFAAALVLVALVYLLLFRTKLGKAMRATADNPDLALVSGISTEQVITWTWVIGGALVGIAGVMLALQAQLKPELGFILLLPLFAATILGGVGSPQGAFVGAMVVGITEEVAVTLGFLSPGYKFSVAFVILILMLLCGLAACSERRRDEAARGAWWRCPQRTDQGERLITPLTVLAITAAVVLIPAERSGWDINGVISFLAFFATFVAIYGIFTLGLNVQWGYTGVFNFGVMAFFLVGANAAAIITKPPASSEYVQYVGGFGDKLAFLPYPGQRPVATVPVRGGGRRGLRRGARLPPVHPHSAPARGLPGHRHHRHSGAPAAYHYRRNRACQWHPWPDGHPAPLGRTRQHRRLQIRHAGHRRGDPSARLRRCRAGYPLALGARAARPP